MANLKTKQVLKGSRLGKFDITFTNSILFSLVWIRQHLNAFGLLCAVLWKSRFKKMLSMNLRGSLKKAKWHLLITFYFIAIYAT